MKTKLYLLLIIIAPLLSNAQAIKIFAKNTTVNPKEVLNYYEGNSIRNPEILNNDTQDPDVFQSMVSANFETFSLDLPIEGTNYTLNLFKNKVFTDDFVLKTSDKGIVSLPDVRTYSGTVEGHTSKMIALTLYEDGIEGLIEIDGATYTLSKIIDTDYHVIYRESNVSYLNPPSLEDDVIDLPKASEEKPGGTYSVNGIGCKVLRVYIEVDKSLYTLWGGTNTAVTAKLSTVFNAAKGYYQNENIEIQLSGSLLWTSTDPYNGDSLAAELSNFKNYWNNLGNSFNGNVAHLFTNKFNGGVAYVDILQSTFSRPSAYGLDGKMVSVGSNFSNYAWNVLVFAHELGHNIGSQHTQSCTWPVGSNGALGAIDNCYPTGGGCAPGLPPVNGGTIMSYCQFIGTSYSTMLTNGFGPLPGNLIRSKIQSSSLLQLSPPPAPAYSGNTNICAFGKAALTGLGCANGTYKWYYVATNGTAVFTGSNYVTPILNANTTYYLECVTPDCVSPRTPILISITNPAGPPPSNLTKCGSGNKVIPTSGCNGGVLNWYYNDQLISTGSYLFATALQAGNTYTYYSQCVVNSCIGNLTPHTITVYVRPSPPTTAPVVTICAGSSTTLLATGCSGTIRWYNSTSGYVTQDGYNSSLVGTGSTFATPLLNASRAYWVTCSDTHCTSSFGQINIIVNTIAVPAVSPPINITAGSSITLSALGCLGSTIWYTSTALNSNISTGVTYTTPILNTPTIYYVRCSSNGCFSLPMAYSVAVNGCLPIRILGIAENINSGINYFEVSNHIKSTSIITGGTVKYDAANFIELLPGFKASSINGSSFRAIIDGCGGF
jgi:hypothetical protein